MPEYKLHITTFEIPGDRILEALERVAQDPNSRIVSVEKTGPQEIEVITSNILPGMAGVMAAMARGITGVDTVKLKKLGGKRGG
jgi:hypothetical protein